MNFIDAVAHKTENPLDDVYYVTKGLSTYKVYLALNKDQADTRLAKKLFKANIFLGLESIDMGEGE